MFLIQVSIFHIIDYIIQCLEGTYVFTARTLIRSFVPYNYFVVFYCVIYLLSPYFNVLIKNISDKSFNKLLLLCFGLFSVWNTFFDFSEKFVEPWVGISTVGMYGSQEGYTIVNFVFMYLLGCWLKKNENKLTISKSKASLGILFCTVIIFGWTYIDTKTALEYCNPIVILLAILIVVLCLKINVRQNKYIVGLAGSSFTCFLAHQWFLRYINIDRLVNENILLLVINLLGVCIGIYLCCFLIHIAYSFCMRPLEKVIGKLCEKIEWTV